MRAFNFKDTYKRFIHKRCFAPSRLSCSKTPSSFRSNIPCNRLQGGTITTHSRWQTTSWNPTAPSSIRLHTNYTWLKRKGWTRSSWRSTAISAAPGLRKNGPNRRILSNFSDFFKVNSLANPHKIKFIQKVDLIGALYKRR